MYGYIGKACRQDKIHQNYSEENEDQKLLYASQAREEKRNSRYGHVVVIL